MTTAAQHPQHHPARPQLPLSDVDIYDPDEVGPRGSPLMTALRPKLEPSPSPPPDIPTAQVSFSPASANGRDKANRLKVRPTSGDAVLVAYLDNNRNPDIARKAGCEGLGFVHDESPDDEASPGKSASDPQMTEPALQHLAQGALEAAFARGSTHLPSIANKLVPDIAISTRQLSLLDDSSVSAYSFSYATDLKSSISPLLASVSGELPPLQKELSRTEPKEQLPSLRSTLGDINRLPPAEKEPAPLPGPPPTFPGSSPANNFARFAHLPPNLPSSPVSPNDAYSRTLSPHSTTSSSYYYTPNGGHTHSGTEYSGSAAGETPNTEISGPAPANPTSAIDRMSIDGITNPQAILSTYVSRPHYCSVKGCPRSEGGKGFKRKNEMIRHGLVHDSPGYVCPFCPDREHKYPRPDNLQRHVRVHHVDKDKDDPMLRDVLAQRPDGPNRGRRRRGPAS